MPHKQRFLFYSFFYCQFSFLSTYTSSLVDARVLVTYILRRINTVFRLGPACMHEWVMIEQDCRRVPNPQSKPSRHKNTTYDILKTWDRHVIFNLWQSNDPGKSCLSTAWRYSNPRRHLLSKVIVVNLKVVAVISDAIKALRSWTLKRKQLAV
jgi:hypothetical protein